MLALWISTLARLNTEEIRQLFQRFDIKGQCKNHRCCALANFLNVATGEEYSVGHTTVSKMSGQFESLVLPFNVRNFVVQFDRGCFPELVEDQVA